MSHWTESITHSHHLFLAFPPTFLQAFTTTRRLTSSPLASWSASWLAAWAPIPTTCRGPPSLASTCPSSGRSLSQSTVLRCSFRSPWGAVTWTRTQGRICRIINGYISLFWRFVIPKVCYSEGLLFRRFVIPNRAYIFFIQNLTPYPKPTRIKSMVHSYTILRRLDIDSVDVTLNIS